MSEAMKTGPYGSGEDPRPIRVEDTALISESCRNALIRYILFGDALGGFLEAVIQNDLIEAAGRADPTNIQLLGVYAMFLYNFAPSDCHGSPEKVRAYRRERVRRGPRSVLKCDWPDGWEPVARLIYGERTGTAPSAEGPN